MKDEPLLLDGKPFNPKPTSAEIDVKLFIFLEGRPGEVFSIRKLNKEAKIGHNSLYRFAEENPQYAEKGKAIIFGCPTALQRYRKMIANFAAGKK